MMREEIRKFQEQLSLSIIFVTHDREEAMSISDILMVMDSGIVKQIGPPTEIYERPIDEFVANFVGYINLLEGEVTDISEEKITFRTKHGDLKIELSEFDLSVGDRLKAGCDLNLLALQVMTVQLAVQPISSKVSSSLTCILVQSYAIP